MEIVNAIDEPRTERKSDQGLIPYRLTVDEFLRLVDLGFFPDKPDVELINGLLVKRMTKRRPHSFSVGKLYSLLHELLPLTWCIQAENPIVLNANSRPEPDIAVIRGNQDDYRDRDPVASDIGLVIEVSESTYRKDRDVMWRLYATAGIPVYWIVNLTARRVEAYSEPSGKGKAAEYLVSRIFTEEQEIPLGLEGVANRAIRVREILP